MLFNITRADWPPNDELAAFEAEKYPGYSACHLQAAIFLGRREPLQELLAEGLARIRRTPQAFIYKGQFDDMLVWRRLMKDYWPRIRVDVENRLFGNWWEVVPQVRRLVGWDPAK